MNDCTSVSPCASVATSSTGQSPASSAVGVPDNVAVPSVSSVNVSQAGVAAIETATVSPGSGSSAVIS